MHNHLVPSKSGCFRVILGVSPSLLGCTLGCITEGAFRGAGGTESGQGGAGAGSQGPPGASPQGAAEGGSRQGACNSLAFVNFCCC